MEDFVRQFIDFIQVTELGKTAEFWIQYTNHVNLCLTLIKAVKTNNFYLHLYCLIQMCDLSFAYNGQNYAKYLTFFSVYMLNVDENHPGAEELLKRGAFTVARSFIPENRCAVDKTIEETFMKHAKSRGSGMGVGISGVSNNPEAYQRWARTMHQRSQFLAKTLAMAQLEKGDNGNEYCDLRPTEISEKNVGSVVEAFDNLLNPLDVEDKECIYCISSGLCVTLDI